MTEKKDIWRLSEEKYPLNGMLYSKLIAGAENDKHELNEECGYAQDIKSFKGNCSTLEKVTIDSNVRIYNSVITDCSFHGSFTVKDSTIVNSFIALEGGCVIENGRLWGALITHPNDYMSTKIEIADCQAAFYLSSYFDKDRNITFSIAYGNLFDAIGSSLERVKQIIRDKVRSDFEEMALDQAEKMYFEMQKIKKLNLRTIH